MCTHSIWYNASLLAGTARVGVLAVLDIYKMLCVQFELLMMGGKTRMKSVEHRQE